MSAMCGRACGYCGRCTAEFEREPEDLFDDEPSDDEIDAFILSHATDNSTPIFEGDACPLKRSA